MELEALSALRTLGTCGRVVREADVLRPLRRRLFDERLRLGVSAPRSVGAFAWLAWARRLRLARMWLRRSL